LASFVGFKPSQTSSDFFYYGLSGVLVRHRRKPQIKFGAGWSVGFAGLKPDCAQD
jgi:hypothetical protein